MSDLFEELQTLGGYRYKLWDYQKSHSELTIRATHPDKPEHNIHLTFTFVHYIQMPTNWRDGELGLASSAEFIEVTKRAELKGSYETLKDILSLFKAESPNGVIYILGNLVAIEHDVEPIYTPTLTPRTSR